VSWADCQIAEHYLELYPATVLEYTVEISPETEVPIKSFQYYKPLDFSPLTSQPSLNQDKSPLLLCGLGPKYRARFDGLEAGQSYTVHLATELGGQTVVQSSQIFTAPNTKRESTSIDTSDTKKNQL